MTSRDRLSVGSSAPPQMLRGIQRGVLDYLYKGVPTLKSPFDLALYSLLMWETKPRTLIEIGSKSGGSAWWFADLLRNYGVDAAIHSIDLEPPAGLEIPGVTFHRGDGRQLGATLAPDMIAGFARPLMIVEDADHRPETTLAVLRFFDAWLKPGEYIVIEDGVVDDLFPPAWAARFAGGPRAGLATFLAERGADYEIDARLCDWFGVNMTWNVNGYLRRKPLP